MSGAQTFALPQEARTSGAQTFAGQLEGVCGAFSGVNI